MTNGASTIRLLHMYLLVMRNLYGAHLEKARYVAATPFTQKLHMRICRVGLRQTSAQNKRSGIKMTSLGIANNGHQLKHHLDIGTLAFLIPRQQKISTQKLRS